MKFYAICLFDCIYSGVDGFLFYGYLVLSTILDGMFMLIRMLILMLILICGVHLWIMSYTAWTVVHIWT
jgi:hypothetical protein